MLALWWILLSGINRALHFLHNNMISFSSIANLDPYVDCTYPLTDGNYCHFVLLYKAVKNMMCYTQYYKLKTSLLFGPIAMFIL